MGYRKLVGFIKFRAMKQKYRIVSAILLIVIGLSYLTTWDDTADTNDANLTDGWYKQRSVNDKRKDIHHQDYHKQNSLKVIHEDVVNNKKTEEEHNGCVNSPMAPPLFQKYGSGLISLDQAVKEFSGKSTSECADGPEMASFCPVPGPNNTCRPARTQAQIEHYIKVCSKPVPLVADDQFFYEFEKKLLATQQLQALSELPSLDRSKLVALGHEVKDGVITCSLGDRVKVRADLVDQLGKPRGQGYDDVRAWVVGGSNRASVDVMDMRNGSYLATFRCLWPGSKTRLYVGVGYPREYRRRVVQERLIGVYRLTLGEFVKGGVKEMTPCFVTPNLPWPCICNFTESQNTSFYCGRPMDPALSCDDLVGWSGGPSAWKKTGSNEAETEMVKNMVRAPMKTVIKQELYMDTRSQGSLGVSTACNKADFGALWTAPQPKGYFDSKSKWHSLLCQNEPEMSKAKIQKCLSHTTVRIFGDSNGFRIFNIFNGMMNPTCVQPSAKSKKGAKLTMWNVHTVCNKGDFHMTFDPHKAHLYAASNSAQPIQKSGDVSQYIDQIPSTGRYVVVVHLYLHLVAGHISIAHNRLLKLRAAIERASSRNKEVFVAFRGPHIIAVEWAENHSLGGDVQSLFYYELIQEVFRDFKDRVIFLDGWEMSIAIENTQVHPSDDVPRAMINTLLSYIC